MRQQIVEIAKNVAVGFISANVIFSAAMATINIQTFLWGSK